ncbi:MAG: thiamine pyrophosphate-binding protein [Butyricicoccus sp.]
MIHMETVRLTASQALVRFLENQYISYIDMDGNEQEHKFVKGIFMLPGHGNVVGFANGVEQELKDMIVYQGKNEQGMALAAVGYAKQMRRKSIFACTSSVGPGACNMVTAAATATANNIPVLILPGDIYASRQPDPVLQQMEQPQNLSISAHDAFQAVTKYWGRINRPEQVMTDMIYAMRVLTDTANTGAVAISLPQDVQAEAYDYPVDFFKKRVWRVDRRPVTKYALDKAVEVIKNAKKPLLICGGGVRTLRHTRYSRSSLKTSASHSANPGGQVRCCLGSRAEPRRSGHHRRHRCQQAGTRADVVIGVGTRYTDFTTASKWLYRTDAKFVNINPSEFQAYKMDATPVVADANEALTAIGELAKIGYHTDKAYAEELLLCVRSGGLRLSVGRC